VLLFVRLLKNAVHKEEFFDSIAQQGQPTKGYFISTINQPGCVSSIW
jgi:hypothetical protein